MMTFEEIKEKFHEIYSSACPDELCRYYDEDLLREIQKIEAHFPKWRDRFACEELQRRGENLREFLMQEDQYSSPSHRDYWEYDPQ